MKDINKKPRLKTPVAVQSSLSIPTAILLDKISDKFGLTTSTIIRDACDLWIEKYRDVLHYNDDIADTR